MLLGYSLAHLVRYVPFGQEKIELTNFWKAMVAARVLAGSAVRSSTAPAPEFRRATNSAAPPEQPGRDLYHRFGHAYQRANHLECNATTRDSRHGRSGRQVHRRIRARDRRLRDLDRKADLGMPQGSGPRFQDGQPMGNKARAGAFRPARPEGRGPPSATRDRRGPWSRSSDGPGRPKGAFPWPRSSSSFRVRKLDTDHRRRLCCSWRFVQH